MAVEFAVEITSHLIHRYAGLELSERYYLDPFYRLQEDKRVAKWAREHYANYDVFIESGEFAASAPPVVRVGGLQPYLIISALFGAEIHFWGDHEPSIIKEPLQEVTDLSSIKIPDFQEHPLIKQLLGQVKEAQKTCRGQIFINPPFFWDDSGWAFIHAPFTTAYKLRGENFFIELYTNPKGVHHLIDIAFEITSSLIDLFATTSERNIIGIHLGDCSASLVSAKHYREYAIPALERMTDRYGPGRLHSCGSSTHLLTTFRDIHGIQEFQLGWDTDLKAARMYLGNVPITYLVPPSFLLQDSIEIEKQMRTALAVNENAPLIWWLAIDDVVPEENVKLAHQIWLEREGRV